MSRLSRLDLAVAALSLGLLALLGLVLWRGDRVGVRVVALWPGDGATAAASSPISIAFAEAMDAASVESRLSVQPAVPGRFIWRDNTVYFLPDGGWQSQQHYQVQLAAGAQTQLGHTLAEALTWSFSTRPAGVVFLRSAQGRAELWAMPGLEGEPAPLTASAGNVFDFAVSLDGEQILYSAFNEEAGIDLWLVQRDGSGARLALACGMDRCYAADWAPDGRVAYSRAPGPLNPGEGYGAPRIWLLEPASGQTVRLHADTQKIGYGPSWSPSANRLAYFDGVESRIVVVDMLSGQETYLPSRVGVVGTWTPDGDQMLFYDTQLADGQARAVLYRADFLTEDILPFFDPQPSDADYSMPVLSPSGAWVALRVRALAGIADQVWVTPADGRYALTADDTADSLFSDFSWDAESQRLLYHRMQLGVGSPVPEIWFWDRALGEARRLVQDGSAPAWLP